MFVLTFKWNKKTAAAIVLIIALILIAIVTIAALGNDSDETQSTGKEIINVRNEKSRIAYLKQYGWEVETPAANEEKVLIPKEFSQVFEKYNELQKTQGFDLTNYSGLEVETYTYKVTNHDSNDTVLAQLYIYKGTVIAADIHSTELDGFITGIKQ